jgi:hypothetical protein
MNVLDGSRFVGTFFTCSYTGCCDIKVNQVSDKENAKQDNLNNLSSKMQSFSFGIKTYSKLN